MRFISGLLRVPSFLVTIQLEEFMIYGVIVRLKWWLSRSQSFLFFVRVDFYICFEFSFPTNFGWSFDAFFVFVEVQKVI